MLNRGDRLGHALALGNNPEKHYSQKGYRAVLPTQVLFSDRLLHAINAECKMSQTTGLRAIHMLRWVFLSENLQFRVFIDTQIQLPVLSLRAIVFSDDRE